MTAKEALVRIMETHPKLLVREHARGLLLQIDRMPELVEDVRTLIIHCNLKLTVDE